MTMIHYLPAANRSPHRPSSARWLQRLSGNIASHYASWRRARMLRALEALPPETLKDIGWPTTDNYGRSVTRK